jgi:Zn-dependent peptidase ImmA (M78 family)
MRVTVRPELLRWAAERSGIEPEVLARRFPRLHTWEIGETRPTLKQLEDFARATHTPIGFLFLAEPPEERIPIPDFRTIRDERIRQPSPDLLDTIYLCQQRQDWYHDFAQSLGQEGRAFVGSIAPGTVVQAAAAAMRAQLAFSTDARRQSPTWEAALRTFVQLAEDAGVLVMVSGVVGNNTHRKLDPAEFRGFALVDDLAPLVFVNGADTKAAQMFTLAHELVHIWSGRSGMVDADVSAVPTGHERWCNEVAAELLVPLEEFRLEHRDGAALRSELDRLARVFKVSTLVILRRMSDAGYLTGDRYWTAFHDELALLRSIERGSGGNFYFTQPVRNSRRFTRALIADTLEGNTLYRDAFRMLGISTDATFRELGAKLGFVV